MPIYNTPLYYEIAFGFVDVKKQMDLFEKFIRMHSKVKVKRVLDIACGPSLQLRELAKRGYEAIGLDLNTQMLNYLEQKAKEDGIKIEIVKADMMKFKLKRKVDFVFIMMGSFRFADNDALLRHLDCVSNSLKKGGLYLIECMELDWLNFKQITWDMQREDIKVRTTYKLTPKDSLTQTTEISITLEVKENGKIKSFSEREIIKHVYPEEFLTLIRLNNKFEFLGWFERYEYKKLKKGSTDNIVLLRKK